MAQQNFKRYVYIDDRNESIGIRASTKVAAKQTTAATVANASNTPTVQTNRGNRGYGIRPRYLRLSRTAGTAPNEKVYYDKLPIFRAADITAMQGTATFDIDGVTWNNVGYVAESIR
jgi:hypothetical protein